MPTFRDGALNILGLTNPGVYVDQILPTPFISGPPTNIEGLVGVGEWGPVNSAQFFSTPDDCAAIYGLARVRPYDLPSYVMTAIQEGGGVGFCGIRVTDGSDTASSAALSGNAGSFTARYTGSRGNQISVGFQASTAVGAYAAIISFPGRIPERFDNILPALQSVTAVAGAGYTSVPSVSAPAAQATGGINAVVQATLKAFSSTLGAGGSGYAVGDTITLPNGVVLTVATVGGGAVATFTMTSPGSIVSGAAPANPVAQASTTGSGTGATFNLTYGLGPAVIANSGYGYTALAALTLTGGGGTGGSYTPVISFWAGLAAAVNNGTFQRGASKFVVFTPGTSTAAPTLNTPVTLAGGTDGAAGVTTSQMVGVDTRPRTGMYALRGSGCDGFTLCDLVVPSTWSTQLAFAISESMLAVVSTASGDTISSAIATRIAQGLDDPSIWVIEGDWPTVYDSQNGLPRLMSPCAAALGILGNLSPEQSPINKRLNSVVATQTSTLGILTSDADESQAQTGGIDFIGRSSALNQVFFSFMTGRNSSSNTAANGIEYTRLTNFLIRSLEGAATRSIVGKLQSIKADDPTRQKASGILNSFFAILADPDSGSDGYGMIDNWLVTCDLTNNSPNSISRGYLFALCQVRYLAVVRFFVIRLAGGNNVDVTVYAAAPSVSQLLAQAA